MQGATLKIVFICNYWDYNSYECVLMQLETNPHLLKSWFRIPPGAWIFVCCESRVLSGRGLCNELITRPEESYRLCCVVSM